MQFKYISVSVQNKFTLRNNYVLRTINFSMHTQLFQLFEK